MSTLSRRTNLHIIGYDAVLAAYPRFVLAAATGDYLRWHLVEAGYHVVRIDSLRNEAAVSDHIWTLDGYRVAIGRSEPRSFMR
jgi:hypothetical protein